MLTADTDWWPAPAKLNLMLRVVGCRPDGYHLLQTVFRFVDYGDRIAFRIRSDGAIRRPLGNAAVPESEDLMVRAARLLQQQAGLSLGADISLVKNIPMGGGLGGGSSDAATVLVALNRLWQVDYSLEKLAELGLRLGADVPVFVRGQAAWAEGVGELLTPLRMPPAWYLVVVPDCHVSTADVFNDPQLTRNAPRTTIRDFLAGSQVNDCLPVVLNHYPEVAAAVRWLETFAPARLTGTGGAVFAEFAGEAEARRVLQQVPDLYKAFVARGLDSSPLLERVAGRNPYPETSSGG
ncbi:4-(cytidine 5'-diphospho)-2-C-methyl-D-erythritol kinase [Sedimenticola hydrogenitrophicus]|uniref:4-(cytidine 5'-diphospho)-2-C-methyl-D-erythritol kinase n=1 Tax=Sedimenticola hydrogenitrophicus TaxID=2967975 RepID=UPI0023AFD4BA|nr:4-(cytidine 5'-diphospho)-2-C-methyl-D-erythritol kinase [Sedimenticola hydrogenitrophicus]